MPRFVLPRFVAWHKKVQENPSSTVCELGSGHVRPRQGTEICNFGAPSPLEALHWIFCFFSSFYVQFSKTSPLKSGESSEKSSGENRVKSCHVCGCHGFFGPDRCIVKGEAQKSPLFGRFSGGYAIFWGFLIFSTSACSLGIPLENF